MERPVIRTIEPADNEALKQLVPKVLEAFGATGEGYACADVELEDMYSAYSGPKSKYWVVELMGTVMGGGGIAPLKNEPKEYCELQKMYFLSELRGQGIGKELIATCIQYARSQGFEYCYLETLPNMEVAQKLYEKFNFQYIPERMGATGHSKCPTFMLLDLKT